MGVKCLSIDHSFNEALSTISLSKGLGNLKKENTQKISMFKAIFLISRSIVGVSVLAQPHINMEFGVINVAFCYPIVASVIIYCLMILPTIADEIEYNGSSLEEFADLTLGKTHRRLATFFNLIFNIACSACGVIFSVTFVNYALCQLGSTQCNNLTMINLVGLLVCLPMAFIHNVAPFVYFGGFCVTIILVSLFSVGGYSAHIIQHHGVAQDYTLSNWSTFFEFFGMACFSLEGIGLIFPIRGALEKPKQFKKLFTSIAIFFACMFVIFGVICHLALGGITQEIVFHNFPRNFTGIYILQFMYASGIFVTFPVFIQATVNIIRRIESVNKYFEGEREYKVSTMLRAVAIVLFFGISMSGVNLLDFMNFAGSLCNSY